LKSEGCPNLAKLMPCPDPRCDKGWIILTEPIVTTDPSTGRRVAVIWRLPCMQCTNNVASCCDGAGSQQPERVPEV
jgi:hypothetical protein